jgi:hypothetical protein
VGTAVFSGCGGHAAKVAGSVTLNGQPLTKGVVSFHKDGGGALATGTIQPDGTYALSTGRGEGLEPGAYTVTVFANEMPKSDSFSEVLPKVLTPEVYKDKRTSPLKFTINRGENKIDLPLTGEPPK